jgi:CRP-like cAMP-binding protein
VSKGELGKIYEDGETLIRQGETGDCMFVIQEGEVEITVEKDGREISVRIAGKDELIGEMAIFEKEARSATARARGRVRALTVDRTNFLRRLNEDPTLAFHIVETMSRRIRELSRQIVQLKEGNGVD